MTTGIRPEQLEQAPLSSTEMLGIIARALEAWAPATIIGYKTLRYDEEIVRYAFFSHLMPPYATSLNGHRRADLPTMVRAVAMLAPDAVTVPLNGMGKPGFKLGEICRANGIALSEDEAHDAMADTKATLALFRHLREVAPATVAMMLALADKSVPNRMLASGDVLLLGGVTRLMPVVGVTPNPTVATSWAAADLTIDPAEYLDLPGRGDRHALLQSGIEADPDGQDQCPADPGRLRARLPRFAGGLPRSRALPRARHPHPRSCRVSGEPRHGPDEPLRRSRAFAPSRGNAVLRRVPLA